MQERKRERGGEREREGDIEFCTAPLGDVARQRIGM